VGIVDLAPVANGHPGQLVVGAVDDRVVRPLDAVHGSHVVGQGLLPRRAGDGDVDPANGGPPRTGWQGRPGRGGPAPKSASREVRAPMVDVLSRCGPAQGRRPGSTIGSAISRAEARTGQPNAPA
jgi:hypothetical protein